MQSRDFCFWLQGFFELSGEDAVISASQAVMIRRHLDMVFHHEIAPAPAGVQVKERDIPLPAPKAPPQPRPEPVRERPDPPVLPHPPTPMC